MCLEKDWCSLLCMLLGVDGLLVQKGWLCAHVGRSLVSMATIGLNLYGRVDLEQLEHQTWP